MADDPETKSPSLRNLVVKSVHDMRTPLSCIKTTAEILKLTASDPERLNKVIGMLDNQVTELNNLLDKLSKTAREYEE